MAARAYLSGLGLMGRRHLKGLVRAGAQVAAFDPSDASRKAALADLETAGLDAGRLSFADRIPAGSFDLAVFAETAAYRSRNVAAFLETCKADRVLLEKPLSSDPKEVEAYRALFAARRMAIDRVSVNLLRRTWAFVNRLKDLTIGSGSVQMTVNGGAFGFGCNGIHYLDLFLYLTGADAAEVRHVKIADTPIASGRGTEFRDYGGEFLIENAKGSCYCAGAATSSAGTVLTLRGDHFLAWVDENDLSWRLRVRKPDSTAPVYRCGFDYAVAEDGAARVDAMDVATEQWAKGHLALPTLEEALPAHRLLHSILQAGGVQPPFRYT